MRKRRARFGDRVDIAVGDLADATSLTTALRDIEKLLLINTGPDLAARGIGHTFVQSAGIMSNTLDWARSIKAEGVVRAATGDVCRRPPARTTVAHLR